jgi:transcriptional regulator with XRE-family HTH domain
VRRQVAPDLLIDLGMRIRQARRLAGYRNVEQLAVQLGVGARTVQRWETGRSEPAVSTLREIALLTGRPFSFFVED